MKLEAVLPPNTIHHQGVFEISLNKKIFYETMSTVAVPIETKVREFYGKLWLGMHLIDYGHRVVLGPAVEIKNSLDYSKPDVYITKDPGDNNIDFFNSLRQAGCIVCGLDTEGGVYPTLEDFAQNKNESPSKLDIYFMWGDAQTGFLKNRSHNSENIITTGNPRFDLPHKSFRSIYSHESEELQKKYGDYVLFNTNFSWANHFKPESHVDQAQRLFGEYDIEKYNYISELYSEFITAIHSLKPHKSDFNIIIRPHPSEDHSTYERNFRNYDNVFVEHSGDVRSWINGAAVVVHNSCTTGIESAMMNRPVLAYRPVQNEKYDKKLPNIVSEEVYNSIELSDRISHYVKNNSQYNINSEQQKELSRYFDNGDISAAEKIAKHIDLLEIPEQQSYGHLKPATTERIKWRIKSSDFSHIAIKTYDSVNTAIGNSEASTKREYQKQKFPGLTKEEIYTALRRFGTDIKTKDIALSIVPRTQNTFIIEAK